MKNHRNNISIEDLIDEYSDLLLGYAFSRLRKHDIAEDMVQETFIAANRAINDFEGRSSYKVWLIGILRHKIIDHLRSQSAHPVSQEPEDSFADYFDKAGHWINKPTNWKDDPALLAENRSFWEIVEHCLGHLSEPVARAFVLRVMEEFGPTEVCENLNITQTNLWNRIYRAKLQLRRCLEVNWFMNS